jgi:hypothetical protein
VSRGTKREWEREKAHSNTGLAGTPYIHHTLFKDSSLLTIMPMFVFPHRASVGRVLFEVGGGGIQKEMAFAALQHAKPRLPVTSEFIELDSRARLGNLLVDKPMSKEKRTRLSSSSSSSGNASALAPNVLIGKMLEKIRLASSRTYHQKETPSSIQS